MAADVDSNAVRDWTLLIGTIGEQAQDMYSLITQKPDPNRSVLDRVIGSDVGSTLPHQSGMSAGTILVIGLVVLGLAFAFRR